MFACALAAPSAASFTIWRVRAARGRAARAWAAAGVVAPWLAALDDRFDPRAGLRSLTTAPKSRDISDATHRPSATRMAVRLRGSCPRRLPGLWHCGCRRIDLCPPRRDRQGASNGAAGEGLVPRRGRSFAGRAYRAASAANRSDGSGEAPAGPGRASRCRVTAGSSRRGSRCA